MTTTATATAEVQVAAVPGSLTLVYDDECEFCRRCHQWLSQQRTYLPLYFMAASDQEAWDRYGALPIFRKELIVVADDGQLWWGPHAFLMAMWATVRFRRMAYRLSDPDMAPLAERFFAGVSSGRGSISAFLRAWSGETRLEPGPGCADSSCELPSSSPPAPHY